MPVFGGQKHLESIFKLFEVLLLRLQDDSPAVLLVLQAQSGFVDSSRTTQTINNVNR